MINATFPGVPAGVNGHPELRPRAYRWRDPARVSPQRLAGLAARDARLIAIEAMCADQRTAKSGRCQPATAEQRDAYRAARETGLRIYQAAEKAGVSTKTASKWEKQRKDAARARDIPAACICRWDWDGRRRWQLLRPAEPGCPWHTTQREAQAS